MSLSVGIVGLPNVGKSTLFNALLKKQQAFVANFPFATIEPNVGVVPLADERLDKLAEVVAAESAGHVPPIVPAVVKFVDIAGLVAGAHKGEGLGNKFLAHIREMDAIIHVIRMFESPDVVKEGSVDPDNDFQVVETELKLADLQTLEKQKEPKGAISKDEQIRWQTVLKLRQALARGQRASEVDLAAEEAIAARQLSLLTLKPALVVFNVDESQLSGAAQVRQQAKKLGVPFEAVVICAKLEADLASLQAEDQRAYLTELGIEETGLERLVKTAFTVLGLCSFLTAGSKEVRSWTIKTGTTAVAAAGVIHSDFAEKFIKAQIVDWREFVAAGGWKKARELGRVRVEGRQYLMQDGEVVEFMIGK